MHTLIYPVIFGAEVTVLQVISALHLMKCTSAHRRNIVHLDLLLQTTAPLDFIALLRQVLDFVGEIKNSYYD
jgi:hypothetical protein